VSEAERIWREKSDDDVIEAAGHLHEFTPAGQRIIREELTRRGLEDPHEQAGAHEGDLPAVECLRCGVPLRLLDLDAPDQSAGWALMLGLRPLVEMSNAFNVFICPQCGHVELFAVLPTAEEAEG